MRGKMMFIAGLGAGFVLGTRAGREKYEELVQAARKVRDNPTVQEAAGVVQEQATKIVSNGKDVVTDKLSNSRFAETKVGERVLGAMDSSTGADPTRRNEPLTSSGYNASTGSTGTSGTTTSGTKSSPDGGL
ncbi:MAG: hypothetical protein QOI74_3946 [Micromonosporaceae bacterium]|jgi:hypothetical protein|nr:hypothetical protein [Micromonosporaceae bacterium]MDT5037654.1 hypothetical protein [Micromonosporaceae bacterium]